MSKPMAYEPKQGQKFQILVKASTDKAYEHGDYAVDGIEKINVIANYRQTYGQGYSFKIIPLPKKYWKK